MDFLLLWNSSHGGTESTGDTEEEKGKEKNVVANTVATL
jgi:hypothetical protein